MGFADGIMQRENAEDIDPPAVSMVFSQVAVTNSLMDKLAKKCQIDKPERSVDTLLERLELLKH